MSDLKKIEDNFHNLLRNALSKNFMDDFKFPTLTRELLKKEEFVMVRNLICGFLYFLKCENGKYVLYARTLGYLNEMFRIDDESHKWIRDGNYRKLRDENNIEAFFDESDILWEP